MVSSLRLRDGNSLREGYDKGGPTRYSRSAMPPRRPSSPRPRPRPRPRAARPVRTRYAPAARLPEVRALLDRAEGTSIYDIAERFGQSPRTALRYLQALQRAGEPLYEEMSGARKVWRIMPTARRQTITLSTSQMVALFLSRR